MKRALSVVPHFGGTSAVAPLWAGLIARINQKLGGRVGFINPQIYALPYRAANDVYAEISAQNPGFKKVKFVRSAVPVALNCPLARRPALEFTHFWSSVNQGAAGSCALIYVGQLSRSNYLDFVAKALPLCDRRSRNTQN